MDAAQEITQLTYGGSWPTSTLVCAGLTLTVLLGLIAWWESRTAGVRRSLLLLAPRVAAIGLLLWMLSEPTLRTTAERIRGKAVELLVDASPSMSVADVPVAAGSSVTRSRIEEATRILEDLESSTLRPIESKAHVLRYRFAEKAEPVSAQDWPRTAGPAPGAGASTDLAAALGQALRDKAGEDVRAVVLLTDGGHNAGADPLTVAGSLSMPVYAVALGNPRPARDVLLHHVQAPRAVLQNDSILIEATVDAQDCGGEELVVELLEAEKRIDQQRVPVPSDMYTRRVSFTPKAGLPGHRTFHVRVGPVSDELTLDNNEASVGVEVTEGKLRLLLVDRLPRWEFRYLRNLLRRDEQTEYDSILLSPYGTSTSGGDAVQFPSRREDWARYRIVILGDLGPDELDPEHQQQLIDYVGRGGGTLVLIAGERLPAAFADQPLGTLLPVEPAAPGQAVRGLAVSADPDSAAVTQLADDALADGRLWREQFGPATSALELVRYAEPRPTARVLVRGMRDPAAAVDPNAEAAFLCWHQFGSGRVVYLSAPITYMLRQRHGDALHHRFWGQLLRWATARELATGSRTVRLTTDKSSYLVSDEIRVTLRLARPDGGPVSGADAGVIVQGREENLARATLVEDQEQPGLYRAAIRGLAAGSFTMEATGSTIRELLEAEGVRDPVAVTIAVEPPDTLEMRNTRCNLPLLQQIAERSGGRIATAAEVKDLIAGIDLSPDVTRTVSHRALWNRWPYLFFVMACLTFEWGMRKWLGLS